MTYSVDDADHDRKLALEAGQPITRSSIVAGLRDKIAKERAALARWPLDATGAPTVDALADPLCRAACRRVADLEAVLDRLPR